MITSQEQIILYFITVLFFLILFYYASRPGEDDKFRNYKVELTATWIRFKVSRLNWAFMAVNQHITGSKFGFITLRPRPILDWITQAGATNAIAVSFQLSLSASKKRTKFMKCICESCRSRRGKKFREIVFTSSLHESGIAVNQWTGGGFCPICYKICNANQNGIEP